MVAYMGKGPTAAGISTTVQCHSQNINSPFVVRNDHVTMGGINDMIRFLTPELCP